MNLTIPIYVEEQPQEHSRVPLYFVRPLFFHAPFVRDENLQRAVTKLAKDLRRTLDNLGKAMRHDELAAYCFAPELSEHSLKVVLDLGQQRVQGRFLFLQMEALGKRIVFTPNIPEFAFESERGESLQERAEAALTQYFRQRERKGGRDIPHPDELSLKGKAWTTTLELDIHPPQVTKPPKLSFFALLGGTEKPDGAQELHRVGRCLDWLYPDDLSRAVCREAEVQELTRLLHAEDKRPILLVGPRAVGKTAIIEEFVFRRVEKRGPRHTMTNTLWLLSPQRLIAGMSYVGQWENRLLAILDEAKRRPHILYFDDLLGLYQAGISANSDLSVAQVLKPFVERQEFRLVAEITPEALRVLQEKDRGFAELFHLLPIKEPTEDDTLRILLSLIKQLENQYDCHFELEVLPTVFDLQRRYVRDAAFPGKAAGFLRQLALKFQDTEITRRNVLEAFEARSGMSVQFLDPDAKLERDAILSSIGKNLIGQSAALTAAADVISIAKARLNDPERPLASFLFLGPTGVGKTQCAKAIAEYLFGEAEKMIRFDMNEYITPQAVARLVGTFHQPEGLLTSAIRRQPFALLLLDEIEKAHPDVFDLLLQVMGEGRLTDALGRTADFTNAIIILTSNLGVRQASNDLGFAKDDSAQTSTYVQAAEKFFRPEFFNRLDHIVPFEPLSRTQIGEIAQQLIRGVFAREGLLRRKCLLRVDERALEQIIDEGYHPMLGARALKRAIERHLTIPVAAQLAPLPARTPTVIHLYPQANGFGIAVQPLVQAELQAQQGALIEAETPEWILEGVEEFLVRAEDIVSEIRPLGDVSLDNIAPEQQRYFAIRDQMRRLQRATQNLARQIKTATRPPRVLTGSVQPPASINGMMRFSTRFAPIKQRWADLLTAQDIRLELQELLAQTSLDKANLDAQLLDVLRETAWLHFLTDGLTESSLEQVLVYFHSPPRHRSWKGSTLLECYYNLFRQRLGFDVAWAFAPEDSKNPVGFVVTGANALSLVQYEEGTHLMTDSSGEFDLVQVSVWHVPPHETPDAVLQSNLQTAEQWRAQLATGQAAPTDSPFRLPPVIRIHTELAEARHHVADLRTGFVTTRALTQTDARTFLLSLLPLPEEL